jgi:hypothetical protein
VFRLVDVPVSVPASDDDADASSGAAAGAARSLFTCRGQRWEEYENCELSLCRLRAAPDAARQQQQAPCTRLLARRGTQQVVVAHLVDPAGAPLAPHGGSDGRAWRWRAVAAGVQASWSFHHEIGPPPARAQTFAVRFVGRAEAEAFGQAYADAGRGR